MKNSDGPLAVMHVRQPVLSFPAIPHRSGSGRGTQLMCTAKHRPGPRRAGAVWSRQRPPWKSQGVRTLGFSWGLRLTLALEPKLTTPLTLERVWISGSFRVSQALNLTITVQCCWWLSDPSSPFTPRKGWTNSCLATLLFISISFVSLKLNILVMLYDKDCRAIAAVRREKGETAGGEAPINNTRRKGVACGVLVRSAVQAAPSTSWLRLPWGAEGKLPGQGEMGKEKKTVRLKNALFLKLAILFEELSGSKL